MPSGANLQETGIDDEPFAPDTGTDFEQSVNSDVLDREPADIRTPVMPHAERHAQPEASHKQSSKSAAKHKHQHSKTKRARRHSPTKSKAPAASLPKTPRQRPRLQQGVCLQPSRCLFAAHNVANLPNEQTFYAVQLARNAPPLTGVMMVRPSALGPAPAFTKLLRPQ